MKKLNYQLVLSSIIFFLAGSVLGYGYSQDSLNNSSIPQDDINDQSMITIPREELSFYKEIITEEKAKIINTKKIIFNQNNIHIYSPLFVNKPLVITEYLYRGDTIVNRSVKLSDTSQVDIWEYQQKGTGEFSRTHFATFDGYENNSLSPSFVLPRVWGWTEEYAPLTQREESSQQQKFYVESELSPKRIGVVKLSTYLFYYQNVKSTNFYPTLISISVNGLYTSDTSDLEYVEALNEAKKIADTITFGTE